jgi:hypothetical protein
MDGLKNMDRSKPLPTELEPIFTLATSALGELCPAGPPRSHDEGHALLLSSRTAASRDLPEYYLIYFLLVDLLGYYHLGQWEKVAWVIPIRYKDRLYSLEHRKFGIGIFAPTHEPNANASGTPSEDAETDARDIAIVINKAVAVASPYFKWRAEQAVLTSDLNVSNKSTELFDRYVYFRNQFQELQIRSTQTKDWALVHQIRREAKWSGQAAIDAFFSWTEHVFIHLAILLGRKITGAEVADLARDEWKNKFKAALDLSNNESKRHYDVLLVLREQIRNFMAHGAFGKKGEAFNFHSGAGAVPVLLTSNHKGDYAFTGHSEFDEDTAIKEIESFILHLWTGVRAPAREHIFSSLPSIISYAADGTYAAAMKTESKMADFVNHLLMQFDNASNMDW